MSLLPLPPLPDDLEPTRSTLHLYANAVGAVAKAHAVPDPKWWHISLKVKPVGLVTDTMAVPGGGTLWLRMDLHQHAVVVETSRGTAESIPMNSGLTGTQFGDAVIAVVAGLRLDGDYARDKFESDDPREYSEAAAVSFFAALVNIDHNLEMHRSSLGDSVGPIQIWPHGFDLAFEWYGTKTIAHEEHGETVDSPSQLNLGFYPAGRAYFYSNPWPFDPEITRTHLPQPAAWNTEGWEGSILYYDDLLATDNPEQRLIDYAQAVFDAASPGLLAGDS